MAQKYLDASQQQPPTVDEKSTKMPQRAFCATPPSKEDDPSCRADKADDEEQHYESIEPFSTLPRKISNWKQNKNKQVNEILELE